MNTNALQLTAEQLQALRMIDGCTVANAIETFHKRLRNEGFADGRVHAVFPDMQPMVGYAATLQIRGSAPPTGAEVASAFPDRTDIWDYILSVPPPRVVVVQDIASRVGLGSLVGAVHMNIFRALGCVGALTNGSVRDLPAARSLGFQLFTGSIAVSHAYVHIVGCGGGVEIAGLNINSGDLLHGDQHGIQTVPIKIAPVIPNEAARIREQEQAIISLCHSPEFSLDNLRALIARQNS